MAAFHVVFRHHAIVPATLFVKDAYRIGLLKESVTDVFFVGEYLLDVRFMPAGMFRAVENAVSLKPAPYLYKTCPFQVFAVNPSDYLGLLRHDDQLSAFVLRIAEKPVVVDLNLALLITELDTEADIRRQGFGLLLRQRRHDRHKHLALGVERIDVLLLEEYGYIHFLQLPRIFEAVDCVAGEAADRLRNDHPCHAGETMKRITKIDAVAKEAKKLRVAAYARVSTDSADQLVSLDAQKEHYEQVIKNCPNWEFAGLYYDEGVSGTKMAKRDGLLRMLADCERGLIDYILVKSISRFSRNTVESVETVRRLNAMGIYIFFEKENIDTGKMEGELMLSIMSSLAEDESRSLSENNKWSIQKRFQNGTYVIGTIDYVEVPQNSHLADNQADGVRCGDNGIFKGMPVTEEQKMLSQIARNIFSVYPFDGKYILDGDRLILCQSNAETQHLREIYPDAEINPLGDWTGGTDVDTGVTNRKLGSDMADSVTGGGLHGKDLSKADVSVNIYAFLKAQETGKPVTLCCAIGDDTVDGRPYEKIVEIARNYIRSVGGFEKFAEWGLV